MQLPLKTIFIKNMLENSLKSAGRKLLTSGMLTIWKPAKNSVDAVIFKNYPEFLQTRRKKTFCI